jgi:hypothetical protein
MKLFISAILLMNLSACSGVNYVNKNNKSNDNTLVYELKDEDIRKLPRVKNHAKF